MSVQKWNQLAEEKSAVDQQTQDIHQKFRMDKISKEFGQLSGQELFKPITKRLDEKSSTTTQEVKESPDYAMDEFDRTYPFGDEFRPDAPTPPPYQYDDGGDLPPPPPPFHDDDGSVLPSPSQPLEETSQPLDETSKRKEWAKPGPVELEYHESIRLQTINRLITVYGNDPNYRVKSEKSPLFGYSVEDLKKERDEINQRRAPLSKQLQQAKQSLKPTPHAKVKNILQPPWKKVMSRRPAVEPSDDEEDCSEQDWEGSTFASAEEFINQLYVSLGSIKAGNSSIKLNNQAFSLLDSLVGLGEIDEKQKKKLFMFI